MGNGAHRLVVAHTHREWYEYLSTQASAVSAGRSAYGGSAITTEHTDVFGAAHIQPYLGRRGLRPGSLTTSRTPHTVPCKTKVSDRSSLEGTGDSGVVRSTCYVCSALKQWSNTSQASVSEGKAAMRRGGKSTKQMAEARKALALAKNHLARVQIAWDEPTDWSDLTMYGLYCVEAAILAASAAVGWHVKKTHWEKEKIAERLYADHGLPDVSELLPMLNSGRKAAAYGDDDFDVEEYDPEDIAIEIEEFVDAVEAFLEIQERGT